jgi:hypothetical protein
LFSSLFLILSLPIPHTCLLFWMQKYFTFM